MVRRARAGRRHRPDLAGPDGQPAVVERLAQRQGDRRVAVPAEVDHGRVRSEQVERELQPGRRGAGVEDQVEVAGRVLGPGERRARAARPARPGPGSGRPGSRTRPGSGRAAGPTHAPTMPAPTTATRSPTSGAPSHSALTAVSTVPASTARRAGTPSGTTVTAAAGHDVPRLVRVEAEDGAPQQTGRPGLDDADVEVAVLHRPGEVALLERRPHRLALARRHAAAEDQGLRAAADARDRACGRRRRPGRGRRGRPGGSRPRPAPGPRRRARSLPPWSALLRA